jgi:hypothetical protein
MRGVASGVVAALLVTTSSAYASDDGQAPSVTPVQRAAIETDTSPYPFGRGVWNRFKPGSRYDRGLPTAALIDGTYTFFLSFMAELPQRAWNAPYPWGTIGHYATRLLYGGAWTLVVGGESLAVWLIAGQKLGWLAEAMYRTDMVIPIDLPMCPRPGAFGGCGIGIGGYSFIRIRPVGTHFHFEAGGGWIQQRVLDDELRTVGESQMVLTPVTALYELKTNPDDPVAFQLLAGPGVFFGVRNAHLHSTSRGRDVYDRIPWHQMYPLDAGVGPGARVEGRISFRQHLTVEGDVTMAPFVLGGPTDSVSADVAPFDTTPRDGVSVWRRVNAGIGYDDPTVLPFKPTLAFFAAELSNRSVDKIGYQGVMMRFDIPLKVPRED